MVAFADTGFLASLYLLESTSARARETIQSEPVVLPYTPLVALELCNSFNRAVHRGRITIEERDSLLQDVESDLASGFLVPVTIASDQLHASARELSNRYTPVEGARTLDLLHVAAALMLDTKIFFSFDHRQRKVAAAEGLQVKPSLASP